MEKTTSCSVNLGYLLEGFYKGRLGSLSNLLIKGISLDSREVNQNFIFLNENNLQYLLIVDVALLVAFFILLLREASKLFSQYSRKKTGSKTSLNYVLQFSLFAFIPSLIVAIFSLILFNVALQKYFDQKITSAVNNSYEVAKNYCEKEIKKN